MHDQIFRQDFEDVAALHKCHVIKTGSHVVIQRQRHQSPVGKVQPCMKLQKIKRSYMNLRFFKGQDYFANF